MNIEVLRRPALRYAYLRHTGAYPEIGATFGRMAEIAGKAGLLGKPDALFVGVYHDDPSATSVDELRSDAGVTLPEDAAIPEGLEEGRIPEGRYAKGIHRGSYSRMTESWMAFWDALSAAGLRGRNESPFELYTGDMETTPENDLITELYAAVE